MFAFSKKIAAIRFCTFFKNWEKKRGTASKVKIFKNKIDGTNKTTIVILETKGEHSLLSVAPWLVNGNN